MVLTRIFFSNILGGGGYGGGGGGGGNMDMASLSKFAGDISLSDRGRGGARGRGGDRGRGDRGGRGARGRVMRPTNYDCVVTRPENLDKKGMHYNFLR